MSKLTTIIKSSISILSILLLTVVTPGSLISSSSIASAATDDCVAPSSSDPGVHQPVGADANMFTYKCDGPYANQWSSDYFVFDANSGLRLPTYAPNYSYDCNTGIWTKTQWDYSAADSQYHSSRVKTANPGQATNCPTAAAQTPATNGGSGAGSASGSGVNSSGPNSNTSTTTNGNNTTTINNNTNATMNNNLTGVANSGNALVLSNTSAGGATSGDSYNQADIVNMLQSSSNTLGSDGNTIVFTKNIDGDVNGDLFLDPNQLSAVQNAGAGSTTNADGTLNNRVNINNSTSASINNNVDLTSNSGDATVSNNTKGGSATSGNAKAVANIVNTINSALVAGQSFIGTININGNLNGDILLPDNFVDQLIAANTPTVNITAPNSTNNANTTANNNSTVNNTNNLGINNNVNGSANTGNTTVSNNTSAGGAKSGNATNTITAFNLTGSKVIGKNSILVFVNAPGGKWVGVIVNAPQGTSSAALGGGITNSGPNSSTNSNSTVNNDATLNNKNNLSINNNINVKANSGDAKVDSNTNGGNATSGDADTRVNLANIEDTSLDLSGWLGILFINVFGTWNGSFGVNTSAGDPIAAAATENASATAGMSGIPQVFSFIPSSNGTQSSGGSNSGSSSSNGSSVTSGSGSTTTNAPVGAVLAASQVNKSTPTPQLQNASQSNLGRTLGIIAGFTILYIVLDAFVTSRSNRKQARKLNS